MTENGVAKALRIIGIVEVICGIILGLVTLLNGDNLSWVGMTIMISSFIVCMMFVGFGEIIDLLQKNTNKQDALMAYLKEQTIKEKTAPKSMLQDIESNLPQM